MNNIKTWNETPLTATYNVDNPEQYDPKRKVTLTHPTTGTQNEYYIMNWHTFSDIGADLETVQVWSPITKRLFEIYSCDEGETFTFSMREE